MAHQDTRTEQLDRSNRICTKYVMPHKQVRPGEFTAVSTDRLLSSRAPATRGNHGLSLERVGPRGLMHIQVAAQTRMAVPLGGVVSARGNSSLRDSWPMVWTACSLRPRQPSITMSHEPEFSSW